MTPVILGLDIGGANLKAATADKRAVSVPFPLWKQPDRLPAALAALVAQFPDAEELAVTMTGELCDCFETKREGVDAIVKAVRFASSARPVHVWSTEGAFLNSEEAKQNHMKVAAANWHALATFAGQYVPEGRAILIDIGSTTTDIIPILDGIPVAQGKTDYDRFFSRELAYMGVRRTPVCAVMPWLVAAELFATVLDAYLILGSIPENPNDCDTADGRPATLKYAHARLARMYCADAGMVPEENIRVLAEAIRDNQIARLHDCIGTVEDRLKSLPSGEIPQYAAQSHVEKLLAERGDAAGDEDLVKYVVSGSGEFLARQTAHVRGAPSLTSLNDSLGPEVSACAPAYAVAVLATERRP